MTGKGSKLSKRKGKVKVSVNLITQFEIIGKKLYLPIVATIKYEQNERYRTFNYKLLKLKLRACKRVVVCFYPFNLLTYD